MLTGLENSFSINHRKNIFAKEKFYGCPFLFHGLIKNFLHDSPDLYIFLSCLTYRYLFPLSMLSNDRTSGVPSIIYLRINSHMKFNKLKNKFPKTILEDLFLFYSLHFMILFQYYCLLKNKQFYHSKYSGFVTIFSNSISHWKERGKTQKRVES